jgi:hypothetical protein
MPRNLPGPGNVGRPCGCSVCACLINGYFSLSEFAVDVHTQKELQALTGLDVIALCLPPVTVDDSLGQVESALLTEIDPGG